MKRVPRKTDAQLTERQKHAAGVVRRLRRDYVDAECALRHSNPLQLLIATILSAQCTDERVNLVTRTLFSKYRTARDFAACPQAELEEAIRSTGFFRNKAKHIRACCEVLVREHGGEVPAELDALVKLPGIGRKTANVVLGTAYGLATGVVVDTHVMRLSRRLGLTRHRDPVKIEQDLMQALPTKEWVNFSHRLIHHGRRICQARRPRCEVCGLTDICPKLGVPNTITP
ncbi:MAG TPA: endonuclease III [Pirellulaceae bacterium]